MQTCSQYYHTPLRAGLTRTDIVLRQDDFCAMARRFTRAMTARRFYATLDARLIVIRRILNPM
jgi:hypothetical protein